MGLIIFGSRQTPIAADEMLIHCPCCETQSWADVMVLSTYYHIYWIPIFPFEKEANIFCKKCGLRRYGRPFTPSLIGNFDEIKSHFRHPWFTFLGAGALVFIIIAIMFSALLR